MNRWKNYTIKYVFKDVYKEEKDVQMLLYMNDELVYTSKKNSFKKKVLETYEIRFNKYHLPYYVPTVKDILIWSNEKEHKRFLNFCKTFKYGTCIKLQDELKKCQCNYKNL